MAKQFTPGCTIGIHNGVAHADEIFALAVVTTIEPDVKITRTRDEESLSGMDFRIDVGTKYDPETGDFDHHQADFQEKHRSPAARFEVGPTYAGFGLIWRHYGDLAIKMVLDSKGFKYDEETLEFVFQQVEKNLVCPVDAHDNGENQLFRLDASVYKLPTIAKLIGNMFPTWLEKGNIDDPEGDDMSYFMDALSMAKVYLTREIIRHYSVFAGKDILLDMIRTQPNTEILVLDKFVPWGVVFNKHPEETKDIKLLVYPSNGNWMWQSTYLSWKTDKQLMLDSNGNRLRCPAPKHLRGLPSEELSRLTDVADAVFVHLGGFVGSAVSKEGAIKMATYILNNQDPRETQEVQDEIRFDTRV